MVLQVFPRPAFFCKGSSEGDLQEKIEGTTQVKDYCGKLKDGFRVTVIDQFDQVTKKVKTERKLKEHFLITEKKKTLTILSPFRSSHLS